MSNNLEFMNVMEQINVVAKGMKYENGADWARFAVQSGELTAADLTAFESAHRIRNIIAHGGALEVSVSNERLEFVRDYILPIINMSALNPQSACPKYSAEEVKQWRLKGLEHYNKQEYEEAVKWFRMAADQGDSKAQYAIAYCHEAGQGIYKDYTEAVNWYRKSAEQGNASAQWNLGVLYENGQGVRQDYAQAAKLYRKSAEQGNTLSLYNLGMFYLTGTRVVPKDEAESIRLLRKAAELDSIDAIKFLINYFTNAGNSAEAQKWRQKEEELHTKEFRREHPDENYYAAQKLKELEKQIERMELRLYCCESSVERYKEESKHKVKSLFTKAKQFESGAVKEAEYCRNELNKLKAQYASLQNQLKKSQASKE